MFGLDEIMNVAFSQFQNLQSVLKLISLFCFLYYIQGCLNIISKYLQEMLSGIFTSSFPPFKFFADYSQGCR